MESERNDQHVKELGRKARERLEEERSKRREIVRLDNDDLIAPQREGVVEVPLLAKRSPSITLKRKRPRSATSNKATASRPNEDRWVPDVSQVLAPTENERSNVVRLYGLPRCATPDVIRRFFSGLSPERVVLLPLFDTVIHGWDSIDGRGKPKVPRLADTVRVFVKFESHPVAALAASRSGELLRSEVEQGGAMMAVAVTVKQVPRKVAHYVIDHLAVDAVSGSTLLESLTYLAKKLESSVSGLLWAMSIRDLRLSLESDAPNISALAQDPAEWDANELVGYQNLARHHNWLIDEYEGIRAYTTQLTFFQQDSSIDEVALDSSIIRLARVVADRLLADVSIIEQMTQCARVKRKRSLVTDMSMPDRS